MLITNKRLRAFTLLELIVVIAIIAILAVIAVPSFTKSLEKSRLSAVKSDITNLRKAIDIYAANNNGYYNQKTTLISDIGDGSKNDNNGGTWGNCNGVLFDNTAFYDQEVKKLLTSLSNKIYDGGSYFEDGAYNTISHKNKRTHCIISHRDTNIISFVLFNIDQKNTVVCWDSTGFYKEYNYTEFNNTTHIVNNFWKCPVN